jgi:hypothetical protein
VSDVIRFHLQPVMDLATGTRQADSFAVAVGDDEGPLVLDGPKANALVRVLNDTFARLVTPQSADVAGAEGPPEAGAR